MHQPIETMKIVARTNLPFVGTRTAAMDSTKPSISEVIRSVYFRAGILSAICFWIFDAAFDLLMFEHSKTFLQGNYSPPKKYKKA